jgi:hypothetical protein
MPILAALLNHAGGGATPPPRMSRSTLRDGLQAQAAWIPDDNPLNRGEESRDRQAALLGQSAGPATGRERRA